MLIPQINRIHAAVERLHTEAGYEGGRLELLDLVEEIPGFVIAHSDRVPPDRLALSARSQGAVHIFVPGDMRRPRERFAIATRIGQALLHERHLPGYGLRPSPRHTPDVKQRQVAAFAGELLCPLWALERELPGRFIVNQPHEAPTDWLVRKIGAEFGVSQSVARIQIEAYRAARRTQVGRA
jgi:Zn-dependent peptidase ImmA (M78 family)